MKFLGNLIWLILVDWQWQLNILLLGLPLMITIIGIPFGLQAMKLGVLALWPFGSKVIKTDMAGGCLSTIMNVIWLVLFGFIIVLTHLLFGLLL